MSEQLADDTRPTEQHIEALLQDLNGMPDDLARRRRLRREAAAIAEADETTRQAVKRALTEAKLIGAREWTALVREADAERRTSKQPDAGRSASHRGEEIRVEGSPDAIRKLRQAVDGDLLPETYVSSGRPTLIEHVSGVPVLVADEDAVLPVHSTPLDSANLARLLAQHATVMKSSEFGWREWTPSQQVLNAVLSGAEWHHLPTLAGIVGIPVIRADGTLFQQAGYDKLTGLYLAPMVPLGLPIPERPSVGEVTAARQFIFEQLLGDFPWHSPADRANYIALMISPYLRRYLRCLTPLGVITASTASSGKTLLTGLVGLLAGQKSLTWPADNPDELVKIIATAFHDQAGVMLFDNLTEGTEIKEAELAGLLTSQVWSARKMGGNSKMLSFVNDRLWMVTGNNLQVGGDIRSRSVLVRLSPQEPNPEQRTGFTIKDLPQQILTRDFQVAVLRHLLVLIMDWMAAGAPRDATHTIRQFTAWGHGVAGFLAHHGIPDFLGNLAEIRLNDAEDLRWAASLARWVEVHGTEPLGAGAVFDAAAVVRDDQGRLHDPWEGAFFVDENGHRPRNAIKLAVILQGHVDRWHGDPPRRLRRTYNTDRSAWDYWVEEYREK